MEKEIVGNLKTLYKDDDVIFFQNIYPEILSGSKDIPGNKMASSLAQLITHYCSPQRVFLAPDLRK